MRVIAEDYLAYRDQLTAIAKWIESEFDYNPQKLANGANTSKRQLTIPDVIKSVCLLCQKNEPIEGYAVCLNCMEDSVK
jgi:hypothetical protein